MSRLSWFGMAVAAGVFVAALPQEALAAAGPGAGVVPKSTTGGPKGQERVLVTGIYRYLSGQDAGFMSGESYEALMMAPVTGGAPLKVLAPRGIMITLQAGKLYEITMEKSAQAGIASAAELRTRPREYELKPGEDLPGVYLFSSITDGDVGGQKRTGLEVTKLGQTSKVWLPNVKDENRKMVPDPKMLEIVKGLKKDDPLKIEVTPGPTPTIKSLASYAAPKEGVFIETTTVKVGNDELVGATIRGSGETVTAVIPKTGADAKLAGVVKRLKAGQNVTFSVRKDGDQTWLEDIKGTDKKPEPAAKKPA